MLKKSLIVIAYLVACASLAWAIFSLPPESDGEDVTRTARARCFDLANHNRLKVSFEHCVTAERVIFEDTGKWPEGV